MGFRYINFIENWLASNVTEADDYGGPKLAIELATQLRTDAIAQGVTPDDMEADPGDLEVIVYQTMHHEFDPSLPGFEAQLARIKRRMDMLLEMINDLKSYNTTVGQWQNGTLVDVTNEWIDDLEIELDQWMLKLESELRENREQGEDPSG